MYSLQLYCCVDRRRRMSNQRTSKLDSRAVRRSLSVSRDHTPRDQPGDYIRRAPNTVVGSMVRCGCSFHSQDSFSSTMLSSRTADQYAPPQPLYAHASSMQLPFPPEVVSLADRKRLQEAAIMSDDGGWFRLDCGAGVERCFVGSDVTLDGSCDHRQPDIVT